MIRTNAIGKRVSCHDRKTQIEKTPISRVELTLPFFAIALISSIIIAFASGSQVEQFRKIGTLPIWLLTAGVMSAGMIIGSSYLIPRIGIGAFFVLLVSGQVLAGMVFGYFGMFGMPPTALTIGKTLGAVLVIVGVYLVTFR